MPSKLVCWNCGESLAAQPIPISRHDQCPSCFEVLHCCRMCRFYAPGRTIDCDEERADPPVEKASANFCDFFRPVNRYDAGQSGRGDKARDKLDALFGSGSDDVMEGEDGSSDDDQTDDDALKRLDNLFDD